MELLKKMRKTKYAPKKENLKKLEIYLKKRDKELKIKSDGNNSN